MTVEKVKNKINKLGTQFRREIRQQQNSHRSGAGADDIYIPRLWCFKELQFLSSGDTMALGVSTMELPAGSLGSSQEVDDDLQSITAEERIEVIEVHPQAFLELATSEESLPPSRPSSSLLMSSPQLHLPSSESLPSMSSHLLQSSAQLPQESVVQSGSLSSISMSCQNFSAPASQPSTSSVEEDSAPKRKKQRKQSSEAHQLISAAIEALGRIQAGNKNSNEFSTTGQTVINSLLEMNSDQALKAERLISDVLYNGRRGFLSEKSRLTLT